MSVQFVPPSGAGAEAAKLLGLTLHPPLDEGRLTAPRSFGDLLREHRTRCGLSQEHLAEKAGISTEAIGSLERGVRRAPYRSTLIQLSIALGLDDAQSAEFESVALRARSRAQGRHSRGAEYNLPFQVSSFVGREDDVDAVRELVSEYRHVSLIGVGGIGKTRVALKAATDLLSAFESTWFVDFAPFKEGSLVSTALLSALNIPESTRSSPLQTIISFLKDKHVLLVLDNCEHVIDGVANVVREILLRCRRVHVLATSRELLGLPGEKIVRVPPLSIPTPESVAALTVDDALHYGAIALFVERAKDADHRFEFTRPIVSTIVDICRRLDGIAFAIELAAARVNVLSISGLARKLDEHFLVSIGGKRTAPPRHRTMRSLLDWSYDLFEEPEQCIFRALSVFTGGFTLELAKDLFAPDGVDFNTVLGYLCSLVDKSLVQCEARVRRYRLLEPTRQYASEKLRQHRETCRVTRAHACALLALVERFAGWQFISDELWRTQVQFERENWRAAMQWAFAAEGDVLIGQRLAGEFINVLYAIETSAEDMRWVRLAIETCEDGTPPSVRAKLEVAKVICSLPLGRLLRVEAGDAAELALELFEQARDPLGAAVARMFIGERLLYKQRIPEGETLLRAALDAALAGGAERLVAYITRTLSIARALAGDLDTARELMRGVLEMYRAANCSRQQAMLRVTLAEFEFRAGDAATALQVTLDAVDSMRAYNLIHYLPLTLNNAAAYSIVLGGFDQARAYAGEALRLSAEAGFSWQLAWASQHLAATAVFDVTSSDRIDLQNAARALGFTDALLVELETSRRFVEQQEYDKLLTELYRELGSALDGLMREGALWSTEGALRRLLRA